MPQSTNSRTLISYVNDSSVPFVRSFQGFAGENLENLYKCGVWDVVTVICQAASLAESFAEDKIDISEILNAEDLDLDLSKFCEKCLKTLERFPLGDVNALMIGILSVSKALSLIDSSTTLQTLPEKRKAMMKPTKVWTFPKIYSIEVIGENKMNAKVIIDWGCGQSLYERACLDLHSAMTELTENEWTVSDCVHERVGSEQAMRSFSIVNQFVDEDEANRLAEEFTGTLRDLSGLP